MAGLSFDDLRHENQRLQVDRGKYVATTMNGLQVIETFKAAGAEADFFARWAGNHTKVLNAQQRLGGPS